MVATSNLPARLRELRERAGLTQRELAERAGVPQRSVSNYEQGLAEPGLGAAIRLARALDVTVEELTEEPENPDAEAPGRGRPRKGGPNK